jgi:hypothetical protein
MVDEAADCTVPLSDFEALSANDRLHDARVIAALYLAREFVKRDEWL